MRPDQRFRDKADLLLRHWLFRGFTRGDIDPLLQHARVKAYKSNEVIFRKGDPGLSMMAVMKGRVRITSSAPNEREVSLNIIDEGEVFGEIALFDGRERSAGAVTMEPTELLILDRRDFLPFLEGHFDVCLGLINVLCERLRRTSEQLEDSVFLVQSARLGKTLLQLAEKYGRPHDGGVTIDLKLSQRELGALVGMRREAMNRQLASWRDEGLITIDGGLISIPDPEGFEQFTEDIIWRIAE